MNDMTVLSDQTNPRENSDAREISFDEYKGEEELDAIMALVDRDLSEPYNIFTYRFFLNNWPNLCFIARDHRKMAGVILCKIDETYPKEPCGYIAMLAVDLPYRKCGIGTKLVTLAIKAMLQSNCSEVMLETEVTNRGALHLYEKIGFIKDERLMRYYLNGIDAFRLKLWLHKNEDCCTGLLQS